MEDQNELLSQFTAITGANEDRARFFLESSAWKLDVAMERYYEDDSGDIDAVENSVQSEPSSEPRSSPQATPKRSKPKSDSNFATLNTLTTSSDEEEEGQAFYAGGSEHSGQQVLGPSKKNKDIVAGMFKSVQKHAIEVLQGGAGSSKVFKGTGYKLGQTSDDTVVIPGASGSSHAPEVALKLWRDGFSVNEGQLRAYTDPANEEFLNSIRRGEIPQELRQGNSEVHVRMEDHRVENFVASEGKLIKPFTGEGYTLGSPAPTVVGSSLEEDKPVNEARAKELVKINVSNPTTNIQIRLADGSRLIGQFNHDHTVAEVRQYIVAARPQYELATFNLLSTYPSRVLDDSQTLAEAGLLNAAIMQKLT